MTDTTDWTDVIGPYVRLVASGTMPPGGPPFNINLEGTDRSLMCIFTPGIATSGNFLIIGVTSGMAYSGLLPSTNITGANGLFVVPAFGAVDPVVQVNISTGPNSMKYWILATPDEVMLGLEATPMVVVPVAGTSFSVSVDAQTLASLVTSPAAGSRWSVSLDAQGLASLVMSPAAGSRWSVSNDAGFGATIGSPLFTQLVQAATDTSAYRTRDIFHTDLVADGSYNITPAPVQVVAAPGAGKYLYVGSVSFVNVGAAATEAILGATSTPNPFWRAMVPVGASATANVNHLLPVNTPLYFQLNAAQTIIYDVCYAVVGTTP